MHRCACVCIWMDVAGSVPMWLDMCADATRCPRLPWYVRGDYVPRYVPWLCQDIRTAWLTRWACMRTRTRRPWIGWVCAWFCLGFSGMCMDVPRMCRRAEGSASDLSNVAAALMFALVFAVARSSPVSSPHLPSLGLGRACDLQRCGVCAGASMFSEDLGTFFLAGQSVPALAAGSG